jgi:hypothetical protein
MNRERLLVLHSNLTTNISIYVVLILLHVRKKETLDFLCLYSHSYLILYLIHDYKYHYQVDSYLYHNSSLEKRRLTLFMYKLYN